MLNCRRWVMATLPVILTPGNFLQPRFLWKVFSCSRCYIYDRCVVACCWKHGQKKNQRKEMVTEQHAFTEPEASDSCLGINMIWCLFPLSLLLSISSPYLSLRPGLVFCDTVGLLWGWSVPNKWALVSGILFHDSTLTDLTNFQMLLA